MSPETPRATLIVVVDDDEAARLSLGQMLRLRKHRVELFTSAEAALAWPRLGEADCIVSDVKMPGMDGEEFLHEVVRRKLSPPVILITAHGDVPMAVRCLKTGAYDFVEKPFEDAVLLAGVDRAVEKIALRREKSRLMLDLFSEIEFMAKSSSPVLVIGETGCGKELVARAIHAQSARADKPFVPVNAGALSEMLLESELFGHAKGAFTGAEAERDGKLVTATSGTLLLDEIESLTLRAQVQMLRVLEDGLVEPLGRDTPRKVDVRLVATTKTDLKELVRAGRMREDFYHRIMVLTIHVPPLRQRPEDIPLLITRFLRIHCERSGTPVPTVPESALSEMLRYPWPGNVRELKHAVERMAITASGGVAGPFTSDELAEALRLTSLPSTSGRLREEMERTEKAVIEAVLKEQEGRINETCAALGVSRRALYDRMKKYGLHKEEFKS
jgi:two-component system C4-dicarboxylate transport response regulator DctD